jgi:peptidoglycan/LPS O-acetylase OafA/YrhL
MGVRPFIWIIWAAVATILAALLIYRGTLLQNEEDQLYLDANAEHQQHEQDLILNRAKRLTPYVYAASALTVLMGLGILAFIVVQAVHNLS